MKKLNKHSIFSSLIIFVLILTVGGGRSATAQDGLALEIDEFNSSVEIELITPLGREVVQMSGPLTLHVHFDGANEGDANDDDKDGQDEVSTEIVSMDLKGSSPSLGEVLLRVFPNVPSLGEIREQVNNTPGVLDIPPFTFGVADSFFDVFFEIELPDTGQTFTALEPKRLTGVITYKPAAPCDSFESEEETEIFDADGNATGIFLGTMRLERVCEDECDWNPDDAHKMHWPQLPDVGTSGVDVDMSLLFLADDFKCTANGPIDDIHIWGSFRDDVLPSDGPESLTFEITIYSDIPATESSWSMPGEPLWSRTFSPGEYSIRKLKDSPEGWYDPAKELYLANNHTQAYQYNFCIKEGAFTQEQGTIYWLNVKELRYDDADYQFGWKTTPHKLRWNDDAVFFLAGNPVSFPMKYPQEHEYAGESLDLAFVITGGEKDQGRHDLGDAPDSSNSSPGKFMLAYPSGVIGNYPTVYEEGSPPYGPIHWLPQAKFYLGQIVTNESEADIGYDEDIKNNLVPPDDLSDLDGGDDGARLTLVLPDCKQASFDYTVTVLEPDISMAIVNVWFDWNRDGDWDDVEVCADGTTVPEWAVQNQQLLFMGSGVYTITTPQFMCWHPQTDAELDPVWMRITIAELVWGQDVTSSAFVAGGSGPASGYEYGETEDYYIHPRRKDEPLKYDWGDAPSGTVAAGYPTLAVTDGANHAIAGPWLGDANDRPDSEPDGQPNNNALGDDNDGNDDEDGITIPTLIPGQSADLTVEVNGGGGIVQGWIDFNGDMTWDASEKIHDGFLPTGIHTISTHVPLTTTAGQTFARFRISKQGGLDPNGPAPDGEVEDHEIIVEGQPQVTTRPISATQCPAVLTQCPTSVTVCPAAATKCPAVKTQCPAAATTCPPVKTQCPIAETACPPVQTQCPAVETECPPILTKCPPLETKCSLVPTICQGVETQCPAVETVCPPVLTECPPTQTKCQIVETSCPAAETKCPPTLSVCPPVPTQCTAVETVCPPVETLCPAVETECPSILTKCPPLETKCSLVPTICQGVETQCPAIETVCPPVVTECPPTQTKCQIVETTCPAAETKCPPTLSVCPPVRTQCTAVETVCPPVETLCPAVDTTCPPVLTRCPPEVTKCSLIRTMCELVETQCPVVETACPPVVTECPPAPTKCPAVATECPSYETRCPATETRCPAIWTKCPPTATICQLTETQCPAVETLCPPLETRCPPIKTKCSLVPTMCQLVETQCPAVETRCPPLRTRCPALETRCPAVLTECPPLETRCPVTETRCPAVWTRCPPTATVCQLTETQCPAVETLCPPLETRCPPIRTKCSLVPTMCQLVETQCPAVETRCPPLRTRCPAVETVCRAVETVCPAVTTLCPPVQTQCPITLTHMTQCPAVETRCPPEPTKCPVVETECMLAETRCPIVETRCPPALTKCPPTETECVQAETRCPIAETRCPPVVSKCPPAPTQCTTEPTVCPPVSTECPAVATECPIAITRCPPTTSRCPVVETTCPAMDTQCPPEPTKCPVVITRCPPTTSRCPVVETTCPAMDTECPPEPTRCPVAITKCPSTTSRCPVMETTCPAMDTECPAEQTKCPVSKTKCPTSETNCPVESTWCPAVDTRCPSLRTRCPAELSVCPPVPTQCTSVHTVCPPVITACPYDESRCPPRSPTGGCPGPLTVQDIEPGTRYYLIIAECPAIDVKCPTVVPRILLAKSP